MTGKLTENRNNSDGNMPRPTTEKTDRKYSDRLQLPAKAIVDCQNNGVCG